MNIPPFFADTVPSITGYDPDQIALFVDLDGVLAPLVDDPNSAEVSRQTVELLNTVIARGAHAGLITGRSARKAQELVPVKDLSLAALHGVEIIGPDGKSDVCPVAQSALEYVQVAAELAQTVGWAFENKQEVVSIHFKQRGRLGQSVNSAHIKAQLLTVLNPLKVEVHEAKQVIEVRPKGARTKGDALRFFVESLAQNTQLVVFIGDDQTDVDAFREINHLKDATEQSSVGREASRRFIKVGVGGADAPQDLVDEADIMLEHQAHVHDFLVLLFGL